MRSVKNLAFYFAAFLCVGCASTHKLNVGNHVTKLSKDEADIYEAVFRDQFSKLGMSYDESSVYYILIDDGDPPPEFLSRFAKFRPEVRKASDATFQDGQIMATPGKPWGSRLFFASEILWPKKDRAVLTAGQFQSYDRPFTLSRVRGRWRVIPTPPPPPGQVSGCVLYVHHSKDAANPLH